jgi:hypothetical protein
VSGTRAQTLGGGLDNVSPGRMAVTASVISGNTAATVNGGGVFVDPGGIFTQSENKFRNKIPNDCVGAGCT